MIGLRQASVILFTARFGQPDCLPYVPLVHEKCCATSPNALVWIKPRSARSQWCCFRNFRLQSCIIKQMTVYSMRSERGLSTIPHCLEWYKLLLRTRLPTAVSSAYIRNTGLLFPARILLRLTNCNNKKRSRKLRRIGTRNIIISRFPNAIQRIQDKCTKHQFIHLLTATFKDLHIENSKNYKR